MKIMLSQPMKGKTNEEIRKEREHLVKEIESNGDIVLDTIFDEAPKNVDEAVFIKKYRVFSTSRYNNIYERLAIC